MFWILKKKSHIPKFLGWKVLEVSDIIMMNKCWHKVIVVLIDSMRFDWLKQNCTRSCWLISQIQILSFLIFKSPFFFYTFHFNFCVDILLLMLEVFQVHLHILFNRKVFNSHFLFLKTWWLIVQQIWCSKRCDWVRSFWLLSLLLWSTWNWNDSCMMECLHKPRILFAGSVNHQLRSTNWQFYPVLGKPSLSLTCMIHLPLFGSAWLYFNLFLIVFVRAVWCDFSQAGLSFSQDRWIIFEFVWVVMLQRHVNLSLISKIEKNLSWVWDRFESAIWDSNTRRFNMGRPIRDSKKWFIDSYIVGDKTGFSIAFLNPMEHSSYWWNVGK